ncbi:MAG: insulinase family protein [Uliginosibacterium sp.]|nr:insulinase family protein [Uliginosibacterium sp.]
MASRVLGGGSLKSRLADRLRYQEGLSYDVGGFLQLNAYEANSLLGLYAIYAPGNLERLQRGLNEELARFVRDGITEQELQDARSGLLEAARIARTRTAHSPARSPRSLPAARHALHLAQEARLQVLSVEDVNAAIRRHLNPAHFVRVFAGDFHPTRAPSAAGRAHPEAAGEPHRARVCGHGLAEPSGMRLRRQVATHLVVPAQAGTQCLCLQVPTWPASRAPHAGRRRWMPACAGMTRRGRAPLAVWAAGFWLPAGAQELAGGRRDWAASSFRQLSTMLVLFCALGRGEEGFICAHGQCRVAEQGRASGPARGFRRWGGQAGLIQANTATSSTLSRTRRCRAAAGVWALTAASWRSLAWRAAASASQKASPSRFWIGGIRPAPASSSIQTGTAHLSCASLAPGSRVMVSEVFARRLAAVGRAQDLDHLGREVFAVVRALQNRALPKVSAQYRCLFDDGGRGIRVLQQACDDTFWPVQGLAGGVVVQESDGAPGLCRGQRAHQLVLHGRPQGKVLCQLFQGVCILHAGNIELDALAARGPGQR